MALNKMFQEFWTISLDITQICSCPSPYIRGHILGVCDVFLCLVIFIFHLFREKQATCEDCFASQSLCLLTIGLLLCLFTSSLLLGGSVEKC